MPCGYVIPPWAARERCPQTDVIFCVRLLQVCPFDEDGQYQSLRMWNGQQVRLSRFFCHNVNAKEVGPAAKSKKHLMKKITLFLFVGFLAAGCSEDDPNGINDGGKNFDITVPSTESLAPVFDEAGGETTLSFTAAKSWTASVVNSRADSWLNVSPTQGPAGEAMLKITTEENETPDERSASIILKSGNSDKTIRVVQKQKDALTVTSSKFEIGAEGGKITVEVKSNVAYSYEIECGGNDGEKWVRALESRGMETSSVTFVIDPNRELEKRQGCILFSDGTLKETVTVYQDAGSPQIVLSQDEVVVGARRSDIAVEVGSNVDVDVLMPEATWIRENKSRSYSTDKYYFTVEENDSYDPRSAEIVFVNKENSLKETVMVTQMQKDALVVAKSEYVIDSRGGNMSFDVQASSLPEVKVECDGGWITMVNSRSIDNYAYRFAVSKLTTEDGREGKIIFSAGELEQIVAVRQKGLKEVRDSETQIMHDLYKALNLNDADYELSGWGFNWNLNTPIDKWTGVTIEDGHITKILCPEYKSNLSGRIYAKGYIPASIGGLTYLKSFIFSDSSCALLEPIPGEMGNLENLEELVIRACNIPGPIPCEIGNLSKLKRLVLTSIPAVIDKTGYHTDFDPYARVEIPDEIGRLTQLESLEINWLLQGGITAEIRNLKQLKELSIVQPSHITVSDYVADEIPPVEIGVIPDAISGMDKLESLHLQCGFSGELPASITDLKNLTTLLISSDFLTGSIPENIGQLKRLEYLSIQGKQIGGGLPESLGQLTNLVSLSLSDSGFSGPVPASLGDCKKLHCLDLARCNLTSFPGSLSSFLDRKENCCLNNDVGLFRIDGNRMTGKIPAEIQSHPNFYLFAPNFLMRQQSGYGFDLHDFRYPACKETYSDCFSGRSIDFGNEYAGNKYTLVFRYNDYYETWAGRTEELAEVVNRLNVKYADKGLKVICGIVNVNEENITRVKDFARDLNLADFPHFMDNMGWEYNSSPFYNDYVGCTRTVPTLGLVDNEGTYKAICGGSTVFDFDDNYGSGHILGIGQLESLIDSLFQ